MTARSRLAADVADRAQAQLIGNTVAEVVARLNRAAIRPATMAAHRTSGGFTLGALVAADEFHRAADLFVLGPVTVTEGTASRTGEFAGRPLTVCCNAAALYGLEVSP